MDVEELKQNFQHEVGDAISKSLAAQKHTEFAELAVFLGFLRGAGMIHHSHHWQTKGNNFFSDHLLFQRLYEQIQTEVDIVGEKLVGAASIEETNYFLQVFHMANFMETVASNESLMMESLKAEILLVMTGEFVLSQLGEKGSLSEGLNQAIGTILDKHEDFIYLLKQRNES